MAFYLATMFDEAGYADLFARLCWWLGIRSPLYEGYAPDGVEVTERVAPGGTTLYLLNHGTEKQDVLLAPNTVYTDLLTGEAISGDIEIDVREVRVLKQNKE